MRRIGVLLLVAITAACGSGDDSGGAVARQIETTTTTLPTYRGDRASYLAGFTAPALAPVLAGVGEDRVYEIGLSVCEAFDVGLPVADVINALTRSASDPALGESWPKAATGVMITAVASICPEHTALLAAQLDDWEPVP